MNQHDQQNSPSWNGVINIAICVEKNKSPSKSRVEIHKYTDDSLKHIWSILELQHRQYVNNMAYLSFSRIAINITEAKL